MNKTQHSPFVVPAEKGSAALARTSISSNFNIVWTSAEQTLSPVSQESTQTQPKTQKFTPSHTCTSSETSCPISPSSTSNINPLNLICNVTRSLKERRYCNRRPIGGSWMDCMSVSFVLVVLPLVLPIGGIVRNMYVCAFLGWCSLGRRCWCKFIDGWQIREIKPPQNENYNYKTPWQFTDVTRVPFSKCF